jgi:hypothetical protein
MNKNSTLLGTENIPLTTTLIVPGRLNHEQMLVLEQQVAGRKIIWLCEDKVVLPSETEHYLAEQNAEAASFSVNDPGLEKVGLQLSKDLGENGVVIFLPGKVNALLGAARISKQPH